MKIKVMLRSALIVTGLFVLPVAQAQEAPDESADVWEAVEGQWDAEEKGDKRWIDRLLTDDFAGWG